MRANFWFVFICFQSSIVLLRASLLHWHYLTQLMKYGKSISTVELTFIYGIRIIKFYFMLLMHWKFSHPFSIHIFYGFKDKMHLCSFFLLDKMFLHWFNQLHAIHTNQWIGRFSIDRHYHSLWIFNNLFVSSELPDYI